MNNDRSQALRSLKERVNTAQTELENIIADLQALRDAEQKEFDGLPDSTKNSANGEAKRMRIARIGWAIEELATIKTGCAAAWINLAATA